MRYRWHLFKFISKIIPIIDFFQKSKMAANYLAAMDATKTAKTRPWDNISKWEHQNSFTRPYQDYKNAG